MITVEVHKQDQSDDIFFKGNLVQSKNGQINIVVGKGMDKDLFEGVILSHNESDAIGEGVNNYVKSAFTQFTGTITITSK